MNKDSGIFSLKDKVIIVTGGTGRYGYHFCEALAGAGGTVILTSRDKERAEKKVGALTEKGLKNESRFRSNRREVRKHLVGVHNIKGRKNTMGVNKKEFGNSNITDEMIATEV